MAWVLTNVLVVALVGLAILALAIRRRSMDRWLGTYILESRRRRPTPAGSNVHVLICVADHFEPQHGNVSPDQALARVENWITQYPRLFQRFTDSDGRPPRHSFFFPLDEYVPQHVDSVAGLCRSGFGDVEVHLHHDHETADQLRDRLLNDTAMFRSRHGLLATDRQTQQLKFGFIHGNWALDNSRPDGRWCGVNNELDVLRQTGCYADFTMPSAPDPTQTRKINSLYYAVDDPLKPKSHNWGRDVGVGLRPADSLMLIQGALLLDWKRRKAGLIPQVENSCLQASQHPSMRRLDLWLKARVQVPTRPDWFFVKLHTHGAPEKNQAVLLGQPMVDFHESLRVRAAANPAFHYHYVTAREMFNLARAAESGWNGSVADARDFELVWNH